MVELDLFVVLDDQDRLLIAGQRRDPGGLESAGPLRRCASWARSSGRMTGLGLSALAFAATSWCAARRAPAAPLGSGRRAVGPSGGGPAGPVSNGV